jgi:5-deoxy-glucuronate isomerase
MLIKLPDLVWGYNEITNMETKEQGMLMDIGLQRIKKGDQQAFYDKDKETALLLISGSLIYHWEGQSKAAARASVFDENPVVLHVPKATKVILEALSDAELMIQKTTNPGDFASKFYSQEEIICDIFGEHVWDDTARRLVRTVFDYNNAPYSNMVIGEVINFPGKWSSYIPHGHAQPEVYFYRFDKDSGFGVGFIGEEAYKITNNSALCIPGGPTHPQATAPGYPMYYCWMIRHLEHNPWISRDNDERYTWLLEKDVKIWPNR